MLMQESVEGRLSDHLLILGGGAAPAVLFMAVAPLRSKHLREPLLPVVILDTYMPTGAPAARFAPHLAERRPAPASLAAGRPCY
jgi:hypothetical protein